MHPTIELAQAVVNELNDGAFVADFLAARSYRPIFKLKQTSTTLVTVVPATEATAAATRGTAGHEVTVDVAIQRRPEVIDDASFDELMALVDRVKTFLRGRRLAGSPTSLFVSIANDPIFVQQHIDEWGQFTSVVKVTYRVTRSS